MSARTRILLEDAAERGIRYLESLHARPVFPAPEDVEALEAVLSGPLPDGPAEPADVLRLLDDLGSPATVASAGGRYFGFVTGGALPVAVAANWLAGAWDQNCFSATSSPAVAALETAAIAWLREALRLPADCDGALVTGATMANFTCLAAARHHVLARAGWDVEDKGLFGAPEITVVVGDEVHGTVLKVLAMLGLGRGRVHRVPTDGQGRMCAVDVPEIAGPTILCLQAGNVNTGAFDPAAEIVGRAREAGAWVHVDGAFGLWARATADYARLAEGYGAADSWATDAHKWLNVPYDCGAAFVRSPRDLRAAMSVSGAYLMLGAGREALDVTPESSRRARAVEVWAALKALGRSGLDDMVSRNCRQARLFAARMEEAGIEVLNEVVLNQVLVAFGDDDETMRAICALQKSGEAWCGATTWQGRQAMRVSFSSWATTEEDMERLVEAVIAARADTR